MLLELTPHQKQLLTELVDGRVREIRTEIRRARDSRYRDELVEQMHDVEQVMHQLHESEWDVRC